MFFTEPRISVISRPSFTEPPHLPVAWIGESTDGERLAEFAGRLWQRNYYEHIVRSDAALDRIRDYILTNPDHWPDDPENPALH